MNDALNQRLMREIAFHKEGWIFLLNVPVGAPVQIAVEAMQAFGKEIQDMIDMAVKSQQEAQAMAAQPTAPIDVEIVPEA